MITLFLVMRPYHRPARYLFRMPPVIFDDTINRIATIAKIKIIPGKAFICTVTLILQVEKGTLA